MQVNMREAKSQLSKLIEKAMNGEEGVIAKAGKPMVKLSKIKTRRPKRIFGHLEGKWEEPDPDWWKPMTDEDAKAFLGL
jgi:antitoxin (DNA-binding transcriptional repressor) of toxin-antitoxin stability system